jgi:hypothetical protein
VGERGATGQESRREKTELEEVAGKRPDLGREGFEAVFTADGRAAS